MQAKTIAIILKIAEIIANIFVSTRHNKNNTIKEAAANDQSGRFKEKR